MSSVHSATSVPAPRQPIRFGLTFAVFAALVGVIGWRLYDLQVVQGEDFKSMGERQVRRTWKLHAPRGTLYDTEGTPLVESLGSWTISCDPRYMDDKLSATVDLARILGITRDELRLKFENPKNGQVLARNVGDAQADAIKALKLSGLYVRREFMRTYREGALAAHVFGFCQADGTGAAGLEQEFNSTLAGKDGKEMLQVDALGKPVLTGFERVAPQAGANVQVTIDLFIQRSLETHLKAAVDKFAPKRAAGVIVRPSTGEIVAMASWPTYDPVTRQGVEGEALRNNVVQLVYEPGSTFKPLIAGAAVADRKASFSETIFCERGKWTYREGKAARTITDHSLKEGGHGNLTVTQGIALSDNILMAKLGLRLGADRLWEWCDHLGFGRKTGICLPGDEVGIVAPRKHWKNMDQGMSVPMGHNISVTPLQLIMTHAAIANRGVWNAPRLVKRVWTDAAEGQPVKELPLPPVQASHRIYEEADALAIQEAMTHTMTEGTGKKADLDGYSSAGKTGTAEKLVNGRYSKENHVGSFVCWAPAQADRRAELCALVVIDDPSRGGHYGSETAAPVVAAVLQESLDYLRIPVTRPKTAEPAEPSSIAGEPKPPSPKRRTR